MYLFLFFLLFSSTEAEAASLPPHILSRAQWGADEELLFSRKRETYEQDRIESDEDRPAEDIAPSNRITDCRRWQEEHPEEFVVAQTTNSSGCSSCQRRQSVIRLEGAMSSAGRSSSDSMRSCS